MILFSIERCVEIGMMDKWSRLERQIRLLYGIKYANDLSTSNDLQKSRALTFQNLTDLFLLQVLCLMVIVLFTFFEILFFRINKKDVHS